MHQMNSQTLRVLTRTPFSENRITSGGLFAWRFGKTDYFRKNPGSMLRIVRAVVLALHRLRNSALGVSTNTNSWISENMVAAIRQGFSPG